MDIRQIKRQTSRIKWFWCVLLSAGVMALTGCASSIQIGGSGGGVFQVGPVMLKAQQGKKKLPHFVQNRALHVVGKASGSMSLQLKNKTRHYWRVAIVHKQPKKKTFLWELRPYQRLDLKRKSPGTLLFPMPDITTDATKKKKLRRATLLLYPEKHSPSPTGRIILPVRRMYKRAPSHRIRIIYGDCSGFLANQIFHRWCFQSKQK